MKWASTGLWCCRMYTPKKKYSPPELDVEFFLVLVETLYNNLVKEFNFPFVVLPIF